jgi:hypothetical protein
MADAPKTVTYRNLRGIDITVDEGSTAALQMDRSSIFTKVPKRSAAPKAKAKAEPDVEPEGDDVNDEE